jgi:hypothetical protein
MHQRLEQLALAESQEHLVRLEQARRLRHLRSNSFFFYSFFNLYFYVFYNSKMQSALLFFRSHLIS